MGRYLITGRPGSGKTTTLKELQARGFTTYNTDEIPGATALEIIATGEVVDWPEGPVDWDTYAWNWQESELLKLLESDDTVFIGAIVGNQEKYYQLFDKVFLLTLDKETLARRLDNHEHERTDEDKARAIANFDRKQDELIAQGLIQVSSMQPVEAIVDEILSHITDSSDRHRPVTQGAGQDGPVAS